METKNNENREQQLIVTKRVGKTVGRATAVVKKLIDIETDTAGYELHIYKGRTEVRWTWFDDDDEMEAVQEALTEFLGR